MKHYKGDLSSILAHRFTSEECSTGWISISVKTKLPTGFTEPMTAFGLK